MRFAHIRSFLFWEPFGTRFGFHFGSFWEPFWTLGAPWGTKWPAKGPAREPKECFEPVYEKGQKIDDFGGSRGGWNLKGGGGGGGRLFPEFWPLWHPWEGFPPARELISGLCGFCRPLWVRVS